MKNDELLSTVKKLSDEDLEMLGIIVREETKMRKSAQKSEQKESSDYDAVIYVDGSFDADSGKYAYGMMITDDKGVHYFNRAYDKDENSSMRNVAGEIAGAKSAMQYCLDNNLKNVKLLYDYNGIQAWCEPLPGQKAPWKRNNNATKGYAEFYHRVSESVKIDFEHVDGHTGVEGNEICDSLAKAALGIKDSKSSKFESQIAVAKPYISKGMKLAKEFTEKYGNSYDSQLGDDSLGLT